MRLEGINRDYLDPVVRGEAVDICYHLGLSSDDPLLERMRDLQAVVLAGSGERIDGFAREWSEQRGGAEVIALPKTDRFTLRYCDGVLFCSHGMGMPSASIALQELMKTAYVIARGDLDVLDRIFWVRVGTSGGIGVPGGTVVITTEAITAALAPYRLADGRGGIIEFDSTYPRAIADELAAIGARLGVPTTLGRTLSNDEFFVEQHRLDGALAFETPDGKQAWLRDLHAQGVRNIEMEGALLAAYMNHWGFPRFAMACVTLLDRLQGDQVTASDDDLHRYTDDAGRVVLAYLAEHIRA